MTATPPGQLALTTTPPPKPSSQLSRLPGTTWQHIFETKAAMSWRVMAHPCDHCLFGPNPLVSRERRNDLLETCWREGVSFDCHLSTIRSEKVTCRAFYDQPDRLLPDDAQVAKRLHQSGLMPGAVEFVEYA